MNPKLSSETKQRLQKQAQYLIMLHDIALIKIDSRPVPSSLPMHLSAAEKPIVEPVRVYGAGPTVPIFCRKNDCARPDHDTPRAAAGSGRSLRAWLAPLNITAIEGFENLPYRMFGLTNAQARPLPSAHLDALRVKLASISPSPDIGTGMPVPPLTAVVEGDSGGPVVDADGRILGVVSRIAEAHLSEDLKMIGGGFTFITPFASHGSTGTMRALIEANLRWIASVRESKK
jgi:hypothetical protein